MYKRVYDVSIWYERGGVDRAPTTNSSRRNPEESWLNSSAHQMDWPLLTHAVHWTTDKLLLLFLLLLLLSSRRPFIAHYHYYRHHHLLVLVDYYYCLYKPSIQVTFIRSFVRACQKVKNKKDYDSLSFFFQRAIEMTMRDEFCFLFCKRGGGGRVGGIGDPPSLNSGKSLRFMLMECDTKWDYPLLKTKERKKVFEIGSL